MILKDDKIREEINNSKKNKHILFIKRKSFLKKIKNYFKSLWINSFTENCQLLALRDFEIMKKFLTEKIFCKNSDYSDRMIFLYNKLKKYKYQDSLEINKNFQNCYIYKCHISLNDSYGYFLRSNALLTIKINNKILFEKNIQIEKKLFKFDFEKFEKQIILKNQIFEVILKIGGICKYYYLRGIYDLNKSNNLIFFKVILFDEKINDKGFFRFFYKSL